jgi:ribosomal protein S18 acetylase RimI-like enzyme
MSLSEYTNAQSWQWSASALNGARLQLRIDGALVGRLTLIDVERPWIELRDLYVEPEQRGRQHGQRLIGLAMHRALAMRKRHMRLVVEDDGSARLHAWYVGLGFYGVGIDRRGRPILESALQHQHPFSKACGHKED